jgi:hypothetical protein
MKNRQIINESYKPAKVIPDTYGNKKINSISYNKKKTQISKNCIGRRIVFCFVGLNPHS